MGFKFTYNKFKYDLKSFTTTRIQDFVVFIYWRAKQYGQENKKNDLTRFKQTAVRIKSLIRPIEPYNIWTVILEPV